MQLDADEARWRQFLTDAFLRQAQGVLHLGAHRGQEAPAYAAAGKTVVWVEAQPEMHARLAGKLAEFSGQRALCALLDEADGRQRTLKISNNDEGVSSSLFAFGPYAQGERSLWPALDLHMVRELTLTAVTLDTLLQANGVDAQRHDHWVVDVQGAELLVLRGARQSLASCRSLVVEVSQVPVYDGAVLWPELAEWLRGQGFEPAWQPARPHDDVLFVRRSVLDAVRAEFHSDHYLRHNARRLEHLASLALPLEGKRVLEVGAGIGDHTSFYVDRGCTVLTTEGRAENLMLLQRRWTDTPAVTVRALDMDAPLPLNEGVFDLIHCYGLLYHLRDPAGAIRFMAAHTDLLLLETCLAPDDRGDVNLVDEPAHVASQALHGTGCRPTQAWVTNLLATCFDEVSVPWSQPCHPEFDRQHAIATGGLFRRVFVARSSRVRPH
jgi:FkbM family methyltransferase